MKPPLRLRPADVRSDARPGLWGDAPVTLKIPESAFRDGLAIVYAHAASYGDLWAVGAPLRHDGELLGEIRAPVRSPAQAAAAAEKCCTSTAPKAACNWSESRIYAAVPEDQRQHLTSVRFVIGRVTASDVAGWSEPRRTTARTRDRARKGSGALEELEHASNGEAQCSRERPPVGDVDVHNASGRGTREGSQCRTQEEKIRNRMHPTMSGAQINQFA